MNERVVTPEAKATVQDIEVAGVLAGRTFVQTTLASLPALVALAAVGGVTEWKAALVAPLVGAAGAAISRAQTYLRTRWGNA